VSRNAVDDLPAASLTTDPLTGALVLALAQLLSSRRTWALARASSAGHVGFDQVARSLRRSEWSLVFTLFPAGMQWTLLSTAAPAPGLFSLFALLTSALLLEGLHIGWLRHRTERLGRGEAAVERYGLPAGTGPRTRTLHSRIVGAHAVLGGLAAVLLLVTTVVLPGSSAGTPLATLIGIAAAAAATAVPFLPVRGILLVRAAIAGDAVHDPTLLRATASLGRAGIAAVPLTALAIALLPATAAGPDLAVTRCLLAVLAVGMVATHFVELVRFRIGDIPKRFRPKG
jgi:hypothetical protein